MALGAKFRKLRLDNEWTLEIVSERCGVDVGTISAIEKRDSSRSKYATKIAKAFGLTVEQIEDDNYIDSTATRVPDTPAAFSLPSPTPQTQTLAEKIAELTEILASLPARERELGLLTVRHETERKVLEGRWLEPPEDETSPKATPTATPDRSEAA